MKIYVSNSHYDDQLSMSLCNAIGSAHPEWQIITGNDISVGDDLCEVMSKRIQTCDAFICILSEGFLRSKYATMELDWALAFRYTNKSPCILPIILDDIQIPLELNGLRYTKANGNSKGISLEEISRVSVEVLNSLLHIDTINNEEKVIEFATRLDKNGSQYINETKQRLEKMVKKNEKFSYACYGVCFLILCGCVLFCFFNKPSFEISESNIVPLIYFVVTNLAVLSISIASARFVFVLGKSFMVEAIRNSDRIHAIDFGDFYLKLFEEEFKWSELKEILQNWNIDKGSAFISQDVKDIDPAVLDALIEFSKNFNKKSDS